MYYNQVKHNEKKKRKHEDQSEEKKKTHNLNYKWTQIEKHNTKNKETLTLK